MADLKISELSALAGANLVAADELAIVDDSASETKKITVSDLIANGVTLISDDTIPGAKILFAAGDIATAVLADSAITTAKIADDAVTAAKLADESTVDLVTTLPASGAFTGQLALDTDDNSLYVWDGSAWQSIAAPGSVSTVSGSTTGEVNIVATTSGSTVTISATLDNTTSAAQFLAGPTGSAGAVGYRTIVGSDLPTATTSAKGGVIINGNGLTLSGDTLEIDNSVTSSATHHVVTYDANGLITGGRAITSADLPAATSSALGGVIPSAGLTVDVAGNLSIDNSVTAGTYTKVTVTSEGVVSTGDTLVAADIPDHSAAKLTSGTIGTSLIANDAITADKIADQSTTKFGGAAGSDNVTIFPTGDFQGQFFYDETTQDLYIYTGSSFVPITVLSGNLVNAGAYNASTNQMSSVTSAGSSAGFSVGAALPAPAQTNLNHYVVVDTSGTGTGAAPAVALAPPDMLLSQGVGTEYSLIDVSNAIAGQTASNISFIASGNIIATDVQAALQEVDTEKIAKAGDTMTGALGIGTASSIVFEGSTADDYETTLTVTDPTADRSIVLPDVSGDIVTTGDTGTVTSTMILDGTIVNADINASAEIAVSKLADGAARQLLQTDAAGTGVEWASNIDIPGTLDVTSTATFDSTVTVTGLITANGKVSFPAGTAAAPGLYSGTDIDTGIYAPAANQFGITTNGTSRFVIDGSSVGINTTLPQAELDVHGVNGSSEVMIRAASGSNTSTLRFERDGFSGGAKIRCDGDTLKFLNTVSNQERITLTSDGSVGIGVTNPSEYNGTSNNLVVGNHSGANGITIAAQDNNAGYLAFADGTGSAAVNRPGRIAYDHSDNTLRFETNLLERVVIDSSGNVGIGNTSPAALLDLGTATPIIRFSDTDITGYHQIQSSNSNFIIHADPSNADANSAISFKVDNSDAMKLDSSGRVLVGTSSALDTGSGSLLQLKDDAGPRIFLSSGQVASDSRLGGVVFGAAEGVGYNSASIEAFAESDFNTDDYPSRLVFSTCADGSPSPTERMRIDNVGKHSIYGDTNVLRLASNQGATTAFTLIQARRSETSTTSTTGSDTFRVFCNGNVENSNNSYGGISDIKLKENIVDASSQWDDIKGLRVRNYNFIEGQTHTQIGVVAQEVETVSPGLVTESPDRDEEGNDLGTVTKSVNYSVLYMKAVKALQEAIERIEQLESEMAAVKAQLS